MNTSLVSAATRRRAVAPGVLAWLAGLLVVTLGAGCIGTVFKSETRYARERAKTSGPAPSEDELARQVGPAKAAALYASVGKETLDLLSFGMGASNMVQMINGITDINKLISLLGNNTADTGLGVMRILALLNGIDIAKQTDLSLNIDSAGNPPANQDTLGAMIYFVNQVNQDTIDDKVIPLIVDPAGLNIPRNMDGGANSTNNYAGPNNGPEHVKLFKLAKVMAHVHRTADADLDKLTDVLNGLCPGDVIGRLGLIIKNVTTIDVLIETMIQVENGDDLIDVLNDQDTTNAATSPYAGCTAGTGTGVANINKMIDVLNVAGLNGTKMGYVINCVGTATTCPHTGAAGYNQVAKIVALLDSISTAARMGELINLAENGGTWTGQQYGPTGSLTSVWTSNAWTNGAPADIVNGADPGLDISTIPRLVEVINQVTDATKLAFVLDNVTDMNKMVRVIQDVREPSDVGYIINALTQGAAPAGRDLTELGEILNNTALADIGKMRELIDGQRVNGNVGTQNPTYLNKMVALIQGLEEDAGLGGTIKTAQLLAEVTQPDKLIDLVYDVSTTANLSYTINNIYRSTDADVNRRNSVHTLAYTVENLPAADIPKLVYIVDNVSPVANLANLVNAVGESEAIDNGNLSTTTTDRDPAGGIGTAPILQGRDVPGYKMNQVISGVAGGSQAGTGGAENLSFVINNVSAIQKMADLLVRLSPSATWAADITGVAKVPVIINGIDTGANGLGSTWNPAAGSRGGSAEMGKLVNMVECVRSTDDMADILMGVTNVNKMVTLVNNVTNSSNLVGVLNAVIDDTNAVNVAPADMVAVVNGIDVTNDVPKLVAILNYAGMTPAIENAALDTDPSDEHQLMADLMAPISTFTQGIGSANMVTLIGATGSCSTGTQFTQAACGGVWNAADTAPAIRLAEVMSNLNANLCYNENCGTPTLARRVGLVRMVHAGVLYVPGPNVTFPGLSAGHLALMMNQATSGVDLYTMMNSTDISDVVVVVGCGDHVTANDFNTPCTDIGEGW